MSHIRFQRSALAAAILSLGFSMGALAQGSAGSSASGTMSSGTGAAAAQGPSTAAGATDRSASGSPAAARSAANGSDRAAANGSDRATANRSDHAARASDRMARSDHRFLEEAYMGSTAEVRLGELAQQKASSSEVKDFGRRMVDDHTKAIEQLSQIAKDDGVQLPAQLDRKHQKTYDRLSKLSGAEFDREYMKEMTSAHRKTISQYEKEAKAAKDQQLQQHAQQTLPTLREHGDMATTTLADLQKGSTVSMRTDGAGAQSTRGR